MRVYIAVFALCLIAAIMTSQPHNSASLPQSNSQTQAHGNVTTAQAADHNCQPCCNPAKTDDDPPKWYAPLKRPEWWLVILGFPTLAVLLWQAIASGNAAAAARDSVKALVRAERAWVIAELFHIAVKQPEGWIFRFPDGSVRTMSSAQILQGQHFWHWLTFVNMGRSAARITGYEVHYGFFDHKKGTLRIEQIHYNKDFERMLAGNETTGDAPVEVVQIHDFVNNPRAEVADWKLWMVVLVSVTYEHVFAVGKPETDLFRFVYDPKTHSLERKATTETDKQQIRNPRMYPPLGAI